MRSIAVAALVVCLPWAARSEDSPMRASLVEGIVMRTPAGGGEGAQLKQGDALAAGDTVATEAGARLEVALASGSLLRLGESSRMTLAEAAPQKAFSAVLLLGNVWAKVHKLLAGETFRIETENAVAGVRGTEFRLEVAPGADDLLRVYEGVVQVDGRDGKWSQRVEAQHELRFRRGEHRGAAKFEAASEKGHKLMDWVRERHEERRPEHEKRRERRHLR